MARRTSAAKAASKPAAVSSDRAAAREPAAEPAPVPTAPTAAPRALRGPVARPAPLRHVVFDALVEMIITRELEPGQHLAEGELAEQLGVSRQPVREALQQLQSEGWVDLRPGQGAFVHTPTAKQAGNLLGVRTVLEVESARLAAERCTDADAQRLWELWRDGREALAAQDLDRMVSANAALHAAIMAIGDNSVLAELGQLVDRRVRWHYTPIARTRGADAWDEHEMLIKAIEANDQKRASELMREHTERTRRLSNEPADNG
jgi:DNA-binding GntR family transcriptional regulator